jgi:hypothetical protein
MTIYKEGPKIKGYEFSNVDIYSNSQFINAVKKYSESGGGLEGSNYMFVAANGTDIENAAELQEVYNKAKLSTPNGLPLSATNQMTIIAAPGYYNFGSTTFVMDYPYVNLVSLDGNRSVIFNSSNIDGTIAIVGFSISDVYVKGVDVQNKPFKVEMYYPNIVIENCKGGNNSFSSSDGFNMSGKFTDCEGGDNSFGGAYNAQGVFIRCKGGANSFGYISSGRFENCTGGNLSFGGEFLTGTASGTFINCVGGSQSFGGYLGTASGTFTNCTGGDFSFGYNGTVSGTFNNCVGGNMSWRSGDLGGKLTGKLYFSRHSFSQATPSAGLGGAIVAFITGDNDFIAQDPL